MAGSINLAQQILAEAQAQGVPPQIALQVAQEETGIQQYGRNGAVIRGGSGEYGVFQLMPETAAALGVNPIDPTQNIQGGISYLKQLYQQFGSWPMAIAAYNAGPGNISKGIIPGSTVNYVSNVLARAGFGTVMGASSATPWAKYMLLGMLGVGVMLLLF
jgi:soluble lytic murein transglycosylase-like protein